MTDPVKPLVAREMFASDEEFFDALVRMARTGWIGPVEPAPPRPSLGPICREAPETADEGGCHDPKISARLTPSPHDAQPAAPRRNGPATGEEPAHVPKNAKGRDASAASAKA
jgi:hypothetical protein